MYKLFIKSSSKKSLDLYTFFLKTLFKKTKVSHSIFNLPYKIKRCTLLKSPHVYKKAKEHFELRTYSAIVSFFTLPKADSIRFLLSNKPKSINTKLLFSNIKKIESKKISSNV